MRQSQRNAIDVESLEPRRLFTTYFVNATTGNDLNSGRSSRTPWQTLSAVNSHTFKRGDKVLLSGTFSNQSLVLSTNATGLTVNSYSYNPLTRATKTGVASAAALADETGDGIDILTSNITIENLTITGAPSEAASSRYSYGIYLVNSGSAVLSRETINHVIVSGFSYSGLCMQGWNTTVADSAGFSNVLIENSSFFGNQVSGIFVGAGNNTGNEFQSEFPADFYANSNLIIKNCQAYNNAGYNAALDGIADGTQVNGGLFTSGGIFVSSVNGAVVQNCTAYNNCYNSSGGVGIWSFDSTRVLFQNDESYDNKTTTGLDGDGFDLDHGVTNSIMQKDFSHGNDGIGFLIATTGGTAIDSNDTVRYCVSDGDGQFEGSSGIVVIVAAAPVTNANIYNNTVLAGSSDGVHPGAISIINLATASNTINVFNNIFYTDGTGILVSDPSPAAGTQFFGNDYWVGSMANNLSIQWGSTTYTTLSDWSAGTAEETISGKVVGWNQDPLLTNEIVSDFPIASLGNLALSTTSPLRREALNLASRRSEPYRLLPSILKGLGNRNVFNRPINARGIGAG